MLLFWKLVCETQMAAPGEYTDRCLYDNKKGGCWGFQSKYLIEDTLYMIVTYQERFRPFFWQLYVAKPKCMKFILWIKTASFQLLIHIYICFLPGWSWQEIKHKYYACCYAQISHKLKSILGSKGQKRNRGARKMNLFTPMAEIWNYDSHILCSKKGSFSEHLYSSPKDMAALV